MPGCCCSPFDSAANQQFNQKKVAHELKRYREKGPGWRVRAGRQGRSFSLSTLCGPARGTWLTARRW